MRPRRHRSWLLAPARARRRTYASCRVGRTDGRTVGRWDGRRFVGRSVRRRPSTVGNRRAPFDVCYGAQNHQSRFRARSSPPGPKRRPQSDIATDDRRDGRAAVRLWRTRLTGSPSNRRTRPGSAGIVASGDGQTADGQTDDDGCRAVSDGDGVAAEVYVDHSLPAERGAMRRGARDDLAP